MCDNAECEITSVDHLHTSTWMRSIAVMDQLDAMIEHLESGDVDLPRQKIRKTLNAVSITYGMPEKKGAGRYDTVSVYI